MPVLHLREGLIGVGEHQRIAGRVRNIVILVGIQGNHRRIRAVSLVLVVKLHAEAKGIFVAEIKSRVHSLGIGQGIVLSSRGHLHRLIAIYNVIDGVLHADSAYRGNLFIRLLQAQSSFASVFGNRPALQGLGADFSAAGHYVYADPRNIGPIPVGGADRHIIEAGLLKGIAHGFTSQYGAVTHFPAEGQRLAVRIGAVFGGEGYFLAYREAVSRSAFNHSFGNQIKIILIIFLVLGAIPLDNVCHVSRLVYYVAVCALR